MTELQVSVTIADDDDRYNELLQLSIASTQSDKALCVFCGASPGINPIYMQSAEETGENIGKAGYNLVYGGGSNGIMGAVSRSAHRAGSKVTAIYPTSMEKIGAVDYATNVQVRDMHARKKLMNAKSLGFLVLPGGIGTLEEVLEMYTWNQLGVHSKFVGILNVNGFYDYLAQQLDTCVREGFLSQATRDLISISPSITELLDRLQSYDASSYKPYFNWV